MSSQLLNIWFKKSKWRTLKAVIAQQTVSPIWCENAEQVTICKAIQNDLYTEH